MASLVFMIMMVVVIGLLFSFSVFGWIITQKGGETTSNGRGYYKYLNWNRVKSCLQGENACRIPSHTDLSLLQYNLKKMSYIQSGCCEPPPECGFVYKSPTVWDNTTGTASTNPDCSTWSNSHLCFDCQSCKAGIFADLKRQWKKIFVMNIICLSFGTIIYFIGCCYLFMNRRVVKCCSHFS